MIIIVCGKSVLELQLIDHQFFVLALDEIQ